MGYYRYLDLETALPLSEFPFYVFAVGPTRDNVDVCRRHRQRSCTARSYIPRSQSYTLNQRLEIK